MQTLYTDRISMTGNLLAYAIPAGCKSIVFHALSGAIEVGDGGAVTDLVTIKQFGKMKLQGNFVGSTLYFKGTNAHIVEVLWTKEVASVSLEGGAIS